VFITLDERDKRGDDAQAEVPNIKGFTNSFADREK